MSTHPDTHRAAANDGSNVRRLRAGEALAPQPLPLPQWEKALRAARSEGQSTGYRCGYIDGWRWGTVCGALIGMLTGAGAIVAGLKLGLLAGGVL